MKIEIFVRIPLLLSVLFFIISFGCKKDPEEVGNSRILEAYPGVHGELVKFVINSDTITCEKINGEYVFQGDIILTEAQLLYSDTTKGAGLPTTGIGYLWPDGEVYYKIDASASAFSDDITAAMDEIEEYTSIKFIKHTIQVSCINFVYDSYGSSSNLGLILGGQKIKLGWSSNGTVIHEICHALGMIHEFARSDRDDYVKILLENIVDTKEYNFDILDCKYKALFLILIQ